MGREIVSFHAEENACRSSVKDGWDGMGRDGVGWGMRAMVDEAKRLPVVVE